MAIEPLTPEQVVKKTVKSDEPTKPTPEPTLSAKRLIGLALLLALMTWAYRAAQVEPQLLWENRDKAVPIITDLLTPSLLTRGEETQQVVVRVEAPCETSTGPVVEAGSGAQITLSSNCLNPGDSLTVSGSGLRPDTGGRLYWQHPNAQGRLRDERFRTDANGNFTVDTDIPQLLEDLGGGETELQTILSWESGRLRASDALTETFHAIIETIFLALMATTLGSLIAIPISFLAARNIMPRTPLGNAVYGLTRTALNITRSVEPLILATIFAIWVSFGPFAGVLALSVSTIANIGKLFSEAAESIDDGPLEAIRSTGGNELEVVWFGVVPQIIPPYLSFMIYYWDINVRMSTIIGFVGGGGIGLALSHWINQTQWNNAATAVWAIVIVVFAMDYISAIVRERLI
ncbi:MAG: phosphonate ABC transporter, permease protein PhnE [Anaerolineales bacterium]|nr:phosphonate ABC transporter, permease protein PhnE [Anaerolineales bacterium]MCB9127792.1 phosphonate ABC transporter, permease protein PhnE [Ardenticatenales bacterium]